MAKKLFLLLLLFGFCHFPVFAESLNVSIRVGETILTFSGKTSPWAQVTFLEEGAVVGTTQADINGDFGKSLVYFEDGTHTVGLFATDSQAKTTSTISYTVSLSLGINTTIGNIIMPPSINLTPVSLTEGEILTIFGEAVPFSTVNLFFSNSVTAQTAVNNQGEWEYEYSTGGLSAGDYNVYAKLQTQGGFLSDQSENKSFSVSVIPSITPTPTPEPTSTPGPGPTSTPGPAASATPALTTTLVLFPTIPAVSESPQDEPALFDLSSEPIQSTKQNLTFFVIFSVVVVVLIILFVMFIARKIRNEIT